MFGALTAFAPAGRIVRRCTDRHARPIPAGH
jgi:hypothetical protein